MPVGIGWNYIGNNNIIRKGAIAATIGKYIHLRDQFSSAREELQNRIIKQAGKQTLENTHQFKQKLESEKQAFHSVQRMGMKKYVVYYRIFAKYSVHALFIMNEFNHP